MEAYMDNTKKLVAIVIPVYREFLSETEQVSLRQLDKVLREYPKVFLMPNSLKGNFLKSENNYKILRVSDQWLASRDDYSWMMMNADFYEFFSDYQYILIYQLDAFVFFDQVQYFCSLGYDYIGAPWRYPSEVDGDKYYVGNGGFSLRKIETTIRLLRFTEKLNADHLFSSRWRACEDRFFTYCAAKKYLDFKIAPVKIAAAFSMEGNPKKYFNLNHRQVPMGCHRWFVEDKSFYKGLIQNYGYDIDAEFSSRDKIIQQEYILSKYLNSTKKEKLFQNALQSIFGEKNYRFVIWGTGATGKRCLKYFEKDNIHVQNFVSNTFIKETEFVDGIIVRMPNPKYLVKSKIIVATYYYESVIKRQLECMGLIENEDYVVYLTLMRRFFNTLYKFRNN